MEEEKGIKGFIGNILKSLKTTQGGFSARKITAFTIVLCVFVAHIAWIKTAFIKEDFSLLEGILLIDYGFIGTLLGMTTYESIKKGNQPTEEVK